MSFKIIPRFYPSAVMVLLLFFMGAGLTACKSSTAATPETATTGQLATPLPAAEMVSRVPGLAERQEAVQTALDADLPILLLPNLTEDEAAAQQVAIMNGKFQDYLFDALSDEPLRTEIMSVRKVLPSDISELSVVCQDSCYRVELYNYALNITTVAIVDVDKEVALSVNHLDNVQPDISPALTELAAQIAMNSPEVIEALGIDAELNEPVMPNVKTALNGSQCERSRHLCVAPTFIVGERALWAIVDLTDEQLVGIRWTELGGQGATVVVTERSLQNEYVWENYCEKSHDLIEGEWTLTYMLTSSDGLKLSDVAYEGKQVMRSAKVVDFHVSYSREDGFGYSDAMGCPMFSSAAVVAFNGPELVNIEENGEVVGFALVQDFRSPVWPVACNYRYEQRYEFYEDGRFRTVVGNLGRGCGTNGIYRPILRLDITASEDGSQDSFAEWRGSDWQVWETEQWQLQDGNSAYTPEGYQYRITDPDGGGFYLEPGNGQFNDGGRGDNAFTYVMRRDADKDEGESDLATIGACCNTDYQQGPEQFLTPAEPVEEEDLIIWYVPQLENSDVAGEEYCWANTIIVDGIPEVHVFPCYAGPMFVPIAP